MSQMDEIQATLKAILAQNEKLTKDMALLKKDNEELRKKAEDKDDRIEANVAKWKETEEESGRSEGGTGEGPGSGRVLSRGNKDRRTLQTA